MADLPVPTTLDERGKVALARAAAGELLDLVDLAAIWRISISRVHTLNRTGVFDAFKVKPAIGSKQFSGVLIHRYLQGEPLYEPTFGRKRGAR